MLLRSSSLICFILFIFTAARAQSGCTDPSATNYDPSAVTNDGSCVYPVTHYSPVLRAALNPIITESSGLIWTDRKLWTHNDSGNPPEIYNVDTTDGHTIQTVVIDNYPNVDWESISADSGYIYVGDAGNNHGSRTDLKILKIAKSDITAGSVVHVNAQAISFSYTDQTSFVPSSTNNFDCEALISIRDSLYIFTKDRGDMQTRVYKLPKIPGTYAVSPYTSYNVNGLITDASYDSVDNKIVLIGYLSGHVNSFLWLLTDFGGVQFFSGNKRRIEIGSIADWQTEGIAYVSADRFFVSCETAGTIDASIYTAAMVFNTTLVKNIGNVPNSDIYPNPTSGILHIDNLQETVTYKVMNMYGQPICSGSMVAGNNEISFENNLPGIYILDIEYKSGGRTAVRFTKQ